MLCNDIATQNDEGKGSFQSDGIVKCEDHGAFSRRMVELAEATSKEGTVGRASVKGLLALQDKVAKEAQVVEKRHIVTEKVKPWKHKDNASQSDKVIRTAEAAAAARAKSAALAASRSNLQRPSTSAISSARLADARVRSAQYVSAKAAMENATSSMTAAERKAYRAELRARFQPSADRNSAGTGAAGVSGSSDIVTGLASLANERIDAAIAAGAFKKIARGSSVRIERDHNASSPFIDTTEYLMNRMVQRQAIVPPWIEKQQEIASSATRFRARLRADWRRHAVRTIASEGGTLDEQIERARLYALAEARLNPHAIHDKKKKPVIRQQQKEQQNQANELLSHIDLSGKLNVNSHLDPQRHMTSTSDGSASIMEAGDDRANPALGAITFSTDPLPVSAMKQDRYNESSAENNEEAVPKPFRDPSWEAAERSYHTLQIDTLNSLTRTYNLQAPDIAKKPYFSLERELHSCYAEVAPQLPEDIRFRAQAPIAKIKISMGSDDKKANQRSGNLIERIGGGTVPVWEDSRPRYGLKEWWKDLIANLRG